MLKQLAPPQHWEVFEQLCRDLWAELLSDRDTHMQGRRGQAQAGVDIYGYAFSLGSKKLVGIQCKGKDTLLNKQVTEDELREEASKALTFVPRPSEFVLATTAPRDARVQSFARVVNAEFVKEQALSVFCWSWPDISEAIQNYPALLKKYYPETFVEPNLSRENNLLILRLDLTPDHENKVAALFELDDLKAALQPQFRFDIRDFILESVSNAYRHGKARSLVIKIEPRKITTTDDGNAFDVLERLNSHEAIGPMQGLNYLAHFLKVYSTEIGFEYRRDEQEALNVGALIFNSPIASIKANRCQIELSNFTFLGRDQASVEGLRVEFPENCVVYTLILDRQCFMMSSLYRYLSQIVGRLPEGRRLKVIAPDSNHLNLMRDWFDPSVVELTRG